MMHRHVQENILLGLQQRIVHISKKEEMKMFLEEMKDLILSYPLDQDIVESMGLLVDRIVNVLNLDYIEPKNDKIH